MADPKQNSIKLVQALDSAAAPELADSLRALCGSALEIDASQVRSVGAQSLQVLLSAAVFWREEGVPLSIVSPSVDFEEALRLLGLSLEQFTAGGASA